MIIPKREAKAYGAVHIDNYLSFVGFCKKVDSDEVCDVDVFMDGKKIDTLKANQNITKVEEIYDIKNHGWEYHLQEEDFEKSHLLEFKCGGEELLNSGIKTLDKNHERFNEYRFLNSLATVDVDGVKDLYYESCVGFLITNENIKDQMFIQYIKDLSLVFSVVEFHGFCFTEQEKEELIVCMNNPRINIKLINDVKDILNIEILIVANSDTQKILQLAHFCTYKSNNIYCLNYHSSIKNKLIKEYKNPAHEYFTQNLYNFSEEEKLNARENSIILFYNRLYSLADEEIFIDDAQSYYQLHNYERIRLILKSNLVKQECIKVWKTIV